MNFEIVTDSSANLTEEMIERFGLHILTLMFRVEGREYYSYVKGEHTDIKQFYDMMRAGQTVETSHINMQTCRDMFESLLKEGKDVLYIGFSSALSGTYNTAAMVAKELTEEYPDRKIYAVDTLAASMGEGLLVYHAAQQRLAGESIEAVKDWLLSNRLNLCHWFTVDNLFHLKRGGRVSATTALVGTLLNIKPVMHVDDEGRLVPTGKVRGRTKSLEALVEKMEETVLTPQEQMVFITHGDCLEDAKSVENMVRQRLKVKDVCINFVDPVIGAHSGPGTVALFFLGSKR